MKKQSLSTPWRFHNFISIAENDVIIPGDPALQHYSVMPIKHHIGVHLKCSKCSVVYLFSSKEQVHWYEKLRLWTDSVPLACVSCRGKTRLLKRLYQRIGVALSIKVKQKEDYDEIVDAAFSLISNGVMITGRLSQKIRMAAKRSGHQMNKYVLSSLKAV
jgi:hypothetical protein